MESNILLDIKKMLSVEHGDSFDHELLLFINSAAMEVGQLGACNPLIDIDSDSTWSDILTTDVMKRCISLVKKYIFIRTKLSFDPPTSGFYTTSLEKELEELKYRLIVQVDGEIEEYDNSELKSLE